VVGADVGELVVDVQHIVSVVNHRLKLLQLVDWWQGRFLLFFLFNWG